MIRPKPLRQPQPTTVGNYQTMPISEPVQEVGESRTFPLHVQMRKQAGKHHYVDWPATDNLVSKRDVAIERVVDRQPVHTSQYPITAKTEVFLATTPASRHPLSLGAFKQNGRKKRARHCQATSAKAIHLEAPDRGWTHQLSSLTGSGGRRVHGDGENLAAGAWRKPALGASIASRDGAAFG
jgi:hypothetical protein